MGQARASASFFSGWGHGAGDGIRTRDINLGKVALYQLSYSRTPPKALRIFIVSPPAAIVNCVVRGLKWRENEL